MTVCGSQHRLLNACPTSSDALTPNLSPVLLSAHNMMPFADAKNLIVLLVAVLGEGRCLTTPRKTGSVASTASCVTKSDTGKVSRFCREDKAPAYNKALVAVPLPFPLNPAEQDMMQEREDMPGGMTHSPVFLSTCYY